MKHTLRFTLALVLLATMILSCSVLAFAADVEGTIVIDANGNLVSETASFSVVNENHPDDVMTYSSAITYNNPGQQVTVTAPADADTYTDMDSMQ